MSKIKSDWWDQLQINFYQAPEGKIAVHAFKRPFGCSYFEVPEEWIKEDDFFVKVHDASIEAWKKREIKLGNPCPVCHYPISFRYRYKGKYFCLHCGSHYETEGPLVKVTRSIRDTK